MLSPTRTSYEANNFNTNIKKALKRPSSSSLSPSPNLDKSKTMEEVWKDINLSSLNNHPTSHQDLLASFHNQNNKTSNFTLQDFLAKPSETNQNQQTIKTTQKDTTTTTVLSLQSGQHEFDFVHQSVSNTQPWTGSCLHSPQVRNVSYFVNDPFEGLNSGAGFCKKRAVQDSDENSNDRRHKRMIKNRESAARSRARKQAYTNELELEVAHLLEENARLRKEQQELRLDASIRLPKKRTLHRSATAPF